mgnify:FL=1
MKPSFANLLGENKMPAPHITRRRRLALAKAEEAVSAPAPKAEAPKAAAKKEVKAPEKKVKKAYKKKED